MKRFLVIVLACMLLCSAWMGSIAFAEEAEDWTQTDITLTFLHGHTDEDVEKIVTGRGFRAMVDKFLEEYPNVTLVEQKTNDQNALMLQQAAANNLTDIVQTGYGVMNATAGTDQLADITDLVDPSLYVGNLFSETYDGKIYGLAMKATEYNYIFYNEDMLHEAGLEEFPTKLEDFLALDEYLDAKDIDLIALGSKDAWFSAAYFMGGLLYEYLGKERGDSLVLSDGTVSWSDPDVQEALSWLPKIAATCNEDFNQQDDLWAAGWYAQGKAFSHVCGSWAGSTLASFAEEYPEVIGATRCAVFPSVSGEIEKTYLMAAEAEGYSVNSRLKRGTPEFEAAFALISQICSSDYAEMMVENGTISAHLCEKEVDTSEFSPMIQDFLAAHNAGYPTGYAPHCYIDASIFNVLKPELQILMDGTSTTEDFGKNVDAAVERFIAFQ